MLSRLSMVLFLSVALVACGDSGDGGNAGAAGAGGSAGSAGSGGTGGLGGTGGFVGPIDQCQNMADLDALALAGADGFATALSDCALASGGVVEPTTICLAGSVMDGGLGVSMGCAQCFGNTVGCTVTMCFGTNGCDLLTDPMSMACLDCIATRCTPLQDACSGPVVLE